MKIAVFVFEFPKLSETFILNQIIGLINAGHEVDIFPYNRGDTQVLHEDVRTYKLLERSYFTPEIPRNWILRFLKAIWLLITHVHRSPTALFRTFNILKYGYPAASLLLFYQTIAVVRGQRSYDIIHGHFGERGNEALRFKELGAVTGHLVVSFYGCDLTTIPEDKLPSVYNWLFYEAKLLLPICDYLAQKLLKAGCPSEKILVNPVGIDLERFRYHLRQRDSTKPLKLLSVCRLAEKKGLEDAVRAVAKARHQGCFCTYEIVGDGYLRSKLENIINEESATDYIQLLGKRTHDELKTIILQKDAFILPSVTAVNGDTEGIPLSLMEASASGMPIISTWHAGIPELVINGVSGFLAHEHDVEELSNFIIELEMNPELCVKLGKSGREIVEKNFNLHHQCQLLNESFKKILQ